MTFPTLKKTTTTTMAEMQQQQQQQDTGYEYSYNDYEEQQHDDDDDQEEYDEYDDVVIDDDDYECCCDEHDYSEYDDDDDDDDGSSGEPAEEEEEEEEEQQRDDDDYNGYHYDDREQEDDEQQQQQQQQQQEQEKQQLSLMERFHLFRQNRNDRWYEITKNYPQLIQHFTEGGTSSNIGPVQHNLIETKACNNLVPLPSTTVTSTSTTTSTSSSSSTNSSFSSSWRLGGCGTTAQIDQYKLDKLLGSGDYHYRFFRGWGFEEEEEDDNDDEEDGNEKAGQQERKQVTWADQCSSINNNDDENQQQQQQRLKRQRQRRRTKQVTIKVFAKRRSMTTEADLDYIQETTTRMDTEISILQAYANNPQNCINLLGYQSVIHSPKNIYMIFDKTDYCLDTLINHNNNKSKSLRRRLLLASSGEPESIKNIVQGILNAVRFLHSKGIYHLDIKPTNIFLVDLQQQEEPDNNNNNNKSNNGTGIIIPSTSIRLSGLSSKVHVNNNEDANHREVLPRRPFVGYPGYAAPELVAELPTQYPDKCDIWSVGCILLAMMRSTTNNNNNNKRQRHGQGQLPPQMERDFHSYGRAKYEKELNTFLNRAKRRYNTSHHSSTSSNKNHYSNYWMEEEESSSCCCLDVVDVGSSSSIMKITAAERKKIAKDLLYNYMLQFEAEDRATIETILQHKYFE